MSLSCNAVNAAKIKGFDLFVSCFYSVIDIAESAAVVGNSFASYSGLPFSGGFVDIDARRSSFVRISKPPVSVIFTNRYRSNIAPSIIRSHLIDVVNHAIRRAASHINKSQPVRSIKFFVDGYAYVPRALVRVTSPVAAFFIGFIACLNPCKMSATRIVGKYVFKVFLGYHLCSPFNHKLSIRNKRQQVIESCFQPLSLGEINCNTLGELF